MIKRLDWHALAPPSRVYLDSLTEGRYLLYIDGELVANRDNFVLCRMEVYGFWMQRFSKQ
jgi:hypothetical protein